MEISKIKATLIRYRLLFFWIIVYGSHLCHGQRLNVHVVNEKNAPLSFATVQVTYRQSDKMDVGFTDADGNYQVVPKNVGDAQIITRYLGYETDTMHIKIGMEPVRVHRQMRLSTTILSEVTIIAPPPPVVVKSDTVRISVDSFIRGDERKVKDLLVLLPGFKIDENGVFFMGKKITHLLVENKSFFNGSINFGINNIPGKVVEKVEVIQDYSDIAFLKDINFDTETALNLKLRKQYQNFIFGEIGAGITERANVLINPITFYYSKKFTNNLITEYNNVGKEALGFKDKMDLLLPPKSHIVNGLDHNTDPTTNIYSSVSDFTKMKSGLVANNATWTINNTTEFSTTTVFDSKFYTKKTAQSSVYLNENGQTDFLENVENNNAYKTKLWFTNAKITINNKSNWYANIKAQVSSLLDNKEGNLLSSLSANNINLLVNIRKPYLSGNAEYILKTKKHHIWANQITFASSSNDRQLHTNFPPIVRWGDAIHLDNNLMEIDQDILINIQNIKAESSYSLNLSTWLVGATASTLIENQNISFPNDSMEQNQYTLKNLIYQAGLNLNREKALSKLSGFVGLRYVNIQSIQTNSNFQKMFFVPKINYEFNIKNKGKVKLAMTRKLQNMVGVRMIPAWRFSSYTMASSGGLNNYYVDQNIASVDFSRESIFKKYLFNVGYSISKYQKAVGEKISTIGIITLARDTIYDNVGNMQMVNMNISKDLNKYQLSLGLRYIDNSYAYIVNDKWIESHNTTTTMRMEFSDLWSSKYYSYTIGSSYRRSSNTFETVKNDIDFLGLITKFSTHNRKITFTIDFHPTLVLYKNQRTYQNQLSFMVRYRDKKKPYELTLESINLLQNDFDTEIYTSSRIFSSNKIYNFPRQFLLLALYKF